MGIDNWALKQVTRSLVLWQITFIWLSEKVRARRNGKWCRDSPQTQFFLEILLQKTQRNEVIARGKRRLNGEEFFSLDKSYYKILVPGRKVTKFPQATKLTHDWAKNRPVLSCLLLQSLASFPCDLPNEAHGSDVKGIYTQEYTSKGASSLHWGTRKFIHWHLWGI